jgi:uncharacterized membrane protein
MPPSCRYDRDNKPRVITPAITFTDFADAALNQVRQYGRSSAAVTIRLLETIAVVAESARRADDRAALRRHAEMIARGSLEGLPEQEDRATVEARFQTAMRALVRESTARA